jgi:hypothetical protein
VSENKKRVRFLVGLTLFSRQSLLAMRNFQGAFEVVGGKKSFGKCFGRSRSMI